MSNFLKSWSKHIRVHIRKATDKSNIQDGVRDKKFEEHCVWDVGTLMMVCVPGQNKPGLS